MASEKSRKHSPFAMKITKENKREFSLESIVIVFGILYNRAEGRS